MRERGDRAKVSHGAGDAQPKRMCLTVQRDSCVIPGEPFDFAQDRLREARDPICLVESYLGPGSVTKMSRDDGMA
jgi:hypothetical protein